MSLLEISLPIARYSRHLGTQTESVLPHESNVTLKSFQINRIILVLPCSVAPAGWQDLSARDPRGPRHGVLDLVFSNITSYKLLSPKTLCAEHPLSLQHPSVLKTRKLCYAERAVCVLICASAMQAKTDLVEREKGAEARSPAGSVSKDLEAIHTRE